MRLEQNKMSGDAALEQEIGDNDQLGPIRVKIITLGDVRVGKSSVIKKHCEPKRSASSYISTIGVDYGVKSTSKKMNEGTSLDIKIDFFDLSGNAKIQCWVSFPILRFHISP